MKNLPVLVIGGGISGITAALELAETGQEVWLVEKEEYLGGNVVKFNKYFPKLCPPVCGLEINFRRIRQNKRITVLTSTEVEQVEKKEGSYTVALSTRPQYITDYCTACGECARVCPVGRPNAFNYHLDKTKAAYLPHPMAFPFRFHIDEQYCLKEECAKCVESCSYEAINLRAAEEKQVIECKSLIITTGWKPNDASRISDLKFGEHPDIITNVMFERITAPDGPSKGGLKKPSDQSVPKKIAFLQCAGSRDENHLPYCSAVCCSASLKHALIAKEKVNDIQVTIYYIDLRVTGRNEDFLEKVKQEENIRLVKGKAGKVEIDQERNQLIVIAEDIAAGKKTRESYDMVVLATGIVPVYPEIPGMKADEDGFLMQAAGEGIFTSGCVSKPMDVAASVKNATAVSIKAIGEANRS